MSGTVLDMTTSRTEATHSPYSNDSYPHLMRWSVPVFTETASPEFSKERPRHCSASVSFISLDVELSPRGASRMGDTERSTLQRPKQVLWQHDLAQRDRDDSRIRQPRSLRTINISRWSHYVAYV